MRASPTLIVLFSLIASGCAGLNASDSPQRDTPPPPEGKKLAELVNAAFKTAKLPGAPEASPVRAAHDAQWGDWIFCIKSNSSNESPKYAVLIGNNAVIEVRSFVSIDGCDKETYHSVEVADQHGGSDGSHADPSRSHHHQ